jgi:tellurite methyltransferase
MPTPPDAQGTPRRAPDTISADYQRDWPRYFDAVGALGPRDTLLRALDAFGAVNPASPPLAIDIGCGEGRDTRELLARGWRVVAFDSSSDGLARLHASAPAAALPRLSAHQIPFEDAASSPLLPKRAELINASFALPFCDPAAFPALWAWIVRTLAPTGLFAGQLFGDRDEWAPIRPASHLTRAQVDALLAPFDPLHLDEVEKHAGDAMGENKHHHLYHIVARKR